MRRVDEQLSGDIRELRQRLIVELQGGLNVSQRALAHRLGVAVGTVNRLLGEMVEAGYVEVFNRDVRPFAYKVTDNGRRYERRLGLEQYSWALSSLRRLEQRIRAALSELQRQGVKRVVFYGAGDVMEATYRVAPSGINELEPDAVLITTLRHAEEIEVKIDASLRSSVEVREL